MVETTYSYIYMRRAMDRKGVITLARKIWGVDSANPVNEELYDCVRNKFGLPKYWGRHLTKHHDGSSGLTKEELSFIRGKGIKVLPIFTVISDTLGYEAGRVSARNAVFHARRLGIPKNTAIFANIEPLFQVDAQWIIGWVETLLPSGYRSGFYQYPVKGEFSQAYCQAVKENNDVAANAILWSAEPDSGTTSERKAPRYNPITPNCKANVWVWQYGRNAKNCGINTNLADDRVLSPLN